VLMHFISNILRQNDKHLISNHYKDANIITEGKSLTHQSSNFVIEKMLVIYATKRKAGSIPAPRTTEKKSCCAKTCICDHPA